MVYMVDRDGTGSHFVTQRPSDPGIKRPGDPVDPVISVQQQTPDNDVCHFSISNVRFAFWAFFRKPEKLGSHSGSK